LTNVKSTELLIQKKKLKRLVFWFCILPLIFAAIAAASLYIFQDYITPYIDSYLVCKNGTDFNYLFWMIPKIESHCHMIIFSELRNHPSADIVIVIDIFVALFFLLYLAINLVYSLIEIINYRAVVEYRLKMRKLGTEKLLLLAFGGVFFVYFSIEFTFFSSELVADTGKFGISRLTAMFSSSLGVGPAFQIAYAAMAPMLSTSIATMLYVHYSGSTQK